MLQNLPQDPVILLSVINTKLRDFYPSILTGYHMNKRHWISVYAGDDIDPNLIEDLVKASYELIVSKLNKIQKIQLSAYQN